jgi:hypothetical protein
METEIRQASQTDSSANLEVEVSSTNSEPDFYSGRDFGDEDAHDLFEI